MKKAIIKTFKTSALTLSVSAITAGLAVSPGLYAQEDLEEIQVTGTRIRQTDGMVTPVPVTAMTTAELTSFQPGSAVSEQLDTLPQFFNTQSSQRGGGILFGSGGGSYLNMRNLGANRTLVLFDGSRVVPADKQNTVNVDTLPTALVRTIDVVTGGASAAYGADAMGGVTNFVLDREFEGLKTEIGTGITEEGDGQRWNFSVAGGRQIGDRMNVIGSLQALEIKQIQRDPESLDGDWWKRWGHVTNPDWVSATATPNVPQRLTLPWVTSSEHSPTGVIWARTGAKAATSNGTLAPFAMNGLTFLEDGSDVRPFVQGDVYAAPNRPGSTKSMSGGPEATIHNRAFGGGPNGQGVVSRSAFAAVQYEFNDSLSGFAQILAGRSESYSTSLRGGAELQDGWFATIYRENAFLPANVGAAMDAAGLSSFQLHKRGAYLGANEPGIGSDNKGVFGTYSWSVGLDAVLPNGWDMRASWQSGESHKRTGIFDEIRVDRMFLAMDAVRDPATGAIVCNVQLYNPTPAQLAAAVPPGQLASPGGSPGGTGPVRDNTPLASPIGLDNSVRDCVPWNVLGQGNASRAALDYLMTPKMGDSYVNQDFAELLVTGDLIEGWNGPISFAAGLTWREQDFIDHALPTEIDVLGPPLNAPQIGIRGIPPGFTGGSANLHQFSTVPDVGGAYDVWEWFGEVNVPIWEAASGVQRLDGSAAFRRSDYSNVGSVDSWKAGLDFQLIEDLRLRATKSRDVREATFSQRFDQQGGGGTINDPRFSNSSFQITSVAGGNPNLNPETANTLVAGFVYQPAWLDGFRVSADWYEVEISDAIAQLGLQRIVDECEINNNPSACSQIERDTTTGFIGRVFNVFLNVAQAKVEGVDVEMSYNMEPNFFASEVETLSFRALGGYVIERSDTPLGGVPLDQSGWSGNPDLTGIATLTYGLGPYSIQLQQRYIADTLNKNTGASSSWIEGRDIDTLHISSGNTTNLQLGYNAEMANGGTWRVAFNVTNLLDRDPPVIASYGTRGGAQTTSSTYDVFGRRYQISLNMDF